MVAQSDAVKQELVYPGKLSIGKTGRGVQRVQEWLTFHDVGTLVDGEFGPATALALHKFQMLSGVEASGVLDSATWTALTAPLRRATSYSPPNNTGLGAAVLVVAQVHLKERPVEIGGDNRGPWVRAYTGGEDGPQWRWCAGFVCFVLRQGCDAIGMPMPFPYTLSCDSLAYEAKSAGRFVNGELIATGATPWSELGTCQIFLVARSEVDWSHVGLSFSGVQGAFSTIEGNTDDMAGSNNGYKVCRRSRGISGKDFIRFE